MTLDFHSKVRSVAWGSLPLGSVVISGPLVQGAGLPELADFPLITSALRSRLYEKYQFLSTTMVKILDPDSTVDPIFLKTETKKLSLLKTGICPVINLKSSLRNRWKQDPGAREGLVSLNAYQNTPYTLMKNWTKSLTSVIKDQGDFGDLIWGPDLLQEPIGKVLAKVLTGEMKGLPRGSSLVDVGIDVSYSMTSSGKAGFVVDHILEILDVLGKGLGLSDFRLWLVGDTCVEVLWPQVVFSTKGCLDSLLKTSKLKNSGTQYGPFFRKILNPGRDYDHRLGILITDGACQDMGLSLRLAEKIGQRGVDYMQLILHRDEEHRETIVTSRRTAGIDGVMNDDQMGPGDEVKKRTDEELEAHCHRELAQVTDIAEAARGGQVILTWYPLFGSLSLDIYEQYLGNILMN